MQYLEKVSSVEDLVSEGYSLDDAVLLVKEASMRNKLRSARAALNNSRIGSSVNKKGADIAKSTAGKVKAFKKGPIGQHLGRKADRYKYEVKKGAALGAAGGGIKGAAKAAVKPVTDSKLGKAIGNAVKDGKKAINRTTSNKKAVVAGAAGLYAGHRMSKEAGLVHIARSRRYGRED